MSKYDKKRQEFLNDLRTYPDKLISRHEVCWLLEISDRTLYRWEKDYHAPKKMPWCQGRRAAYKAKTFLKWLEG